MKQETWQPPRTQPELETLPFDSLVTTCPLSGPRLLFCVLWGLTLVFTLKAFSCLGPSSVTPGMPHGAAACSSVTANEISNKAVSSWEVHSHRLLACCLGNQASAGRRCDKQTGRETQHFFPKRPWGQGLWSCMRQGLPCLWHAPEWPPGPIPSPHFVAT